MKYLFLDIDGVLNHESWYKNRVSLYKDDFTEWWESCFDPICVAHLLNILDKTNARLCVSSSWRSDPNLKKYFEQLDIPIDFDVTPHINRKDENGASVWVDRGEEIDAFLKDHPCDQYVILDDDKDFTEEQIKNHFVHCCADLVEAFKEGNVGETGLTEKKMNEAIKILNSN